MHDPLFLSAGMMDSPAGRAVGFQGESEAFAGVKVFDDPATGALAFSPSPEEFDRGTRQMKVSPSPCDKTRQKGRSKERADELKRGYPDAL
jgi:hypothetical protein